MNLTAIPEPLINQVLGNQAVLFLGAGASAGAKSSNGDTPPLGNTLRDSICDKFLGGSLKDRSLAEISDYVINEYDLITLQEYVRETFLPFGPSDFHEKIPLFPWHAIVTTNYDLVVERAYERSRNKIREIEPYIKNGEKIDVRLRKSHDRIAYIKLHGCINSYSDTSIPLILSNEQLSRFRDNRDRLFQRFRDLGQQCSIVFCGYSLADSNIRDILYDLTDLNIERPRYYLVKRSTDEYERRYWEKNRFTVIESDFASFLDALHARTTELGRVTATLNLPGSTTLNTFYKTTSPTESSELIRFLGTDVTHIRIGMSVSGDSASNFYSGYDKGWWGVEQGLDIYRDVLDSIVVEAILKPHEKATGVDLFVIKGPAGNGKTVALKRIAWDAANDYEQLVLFLNEDGALNRQCIQEIYDLTGKRIIIFVDHVALYVDDVQALLAFAKSRKIPLTIIASERDNEWNVRCEDLEAYLSNEFSIGYLSAKEIRQLIAKLEQYKCLGQLQGKSPEARIAAFEKQAQRQLLVALHEVTQGRPFEQIIKDEYERIIPDAARFLYLDICTLNRLGVSVRAGLIARISGITFEHFAKDFFSPLEHLVTTTKHPYLNDHLYAARHPHVAELVFAQALANPEDRFDQIVRLLKGINVDYTSDNEAFHSLIKGRAIGDIFASAELGRKLFEIARQVAKGSPFVFQQEAIFEMNHNAGSLTRAQKAIDQALQLAPWDRSIQHTAANLKRRHAMKARTPLERETLRKEAMSMLSGALDRDNNQPHGLYTYAQLLVDELEELLDVEHEDPASSSAEDRRIAEIVKGFENAITNGRQRFPRNEQFSLLEGRFLTLLNQHGKAERALIKAFDTNPRNEFIASRLAAKFEASARIDEAKAVLGKCLEANPGGRLIHLKLALHLMKHGTQSESPLILDHLRKSFTDGDANLMAQFWYGRELFVQGRYPESKGIFDRLYEVPMSPALRNEVRGRLRDSGGNVKVFSGEFVAFEMSFGFIKSSTFPVDIFAQSKDSDEAEWSKFSRHEKVRFSVAFTMRGPRAISVIRAL